MLGNSVSFDCSKCAHSNDCERKQGSGPEGEVLQNTGGLFLVLSSIYLSVHCPTIPPTEALSGLKSALSGLKSTLTNLKPALSGLKSTLTNLKPALSCLDPVRAGSRPERTDFKLERANFRP